MLVINFIKGKKVAPLAGSEDRNIKQNNRIRKIVIVAPLAGSEDRNPTGEGAIFYTASRSPRGERG